jgi:aspartate/glutamate racemase
MLRRTKKLLFFGAYKSSNISCIIPKNRSSVARGLKLLATEAEMAKAFLKDTLRIGFVSLLLCKSENEMYVNQKIVIALHQNLHR